MILAKNLVYWSLLISLMPSASTSEEVALPQRNPSTADRESGWEEIERGKDGATGYVLSRRSAAVAGTSVYRMVTKVDGTIEDVSQAAIAFLTNQRYVPKGQIRTTLRATNREVVSHLRIKLPLASDRDVTSRVVFEEPGDDGTQRITWREIDDEGPRPLPGVVRIPRLRGSFAFSPASSGGTDVVYKMEMDLGGRVPTSIVRAFFPRQMKAQIDGLRVALADLVAGAHTHGEQSARDAETL